MEAENGITMIMNCLPQDGSVGLDTRMHFMECELLLNSS